MKLFKRMKDGGPESTVFGFFFIEIKKLFSIALLNFKGDSREAFHTHAFNAVSWVLKGQLVEQPMYGDRRGYKASIIPIYTPRTMFHKVDSVGSTWVLTFRGPWVEKWLEYLPAYEQHVVLTHGRKEVERF